jgi:hypothetical protein
MAALLWCILGFTAFALLALPSSAWKALWQLLRQIREVHFLAKVKK